MFAESGACIFGRRTCEITNGWGGRHPVNGVPVFVLTHHPPAEYPAKTLEPHVHHRWHRGRDGEGAFATHLRYRVSGELEDRPPPGRERN